MKLGAVLLTLFTLAIPSLAQDESCDGNTYDTAVCLLRVLKKADAELNAVYQKSLKVANDFTPADAQNLKNAERKWISYRDSTCKAETGLWGVGTGGPATHSICLIRITEQRIDDLKAAYLSR